MALVAQEQVEVATHHPIVANEIIVLPAEGAAHEPPVTGNVPQDRRLSFLGGFEMSEKLLFLALVEERVLPF